MFIYGGYVSTPKMEKINRSKNSFKRYFRKGVEFNIIDPAIDNKSLLNDYIINEMDYGEEVIRWTHYAGYGSGVKPGTFLGYRTKKVSKLKVLH